MVVYSGKIFLMSMVPKKIRFILLGLCLIGVACAVYLALRTDVPFNCQDNNPCDLLSEKEGELVNEVQRG